MLRIPPRSPIAPRNAPLTDGIRSIGTVSSRPLSRNVQVTPWPFVPVADWMLVLVQMPGARSVHGAAGVERIERHRLHPVGRAGPDVRRRRKTSTGPRWRRRSSRCVPRYGRLRDDVPGGAAVARRRAGDPGVPVQGRDDGVLRVLRVDADAAGHSAPVRCRAASRCVHVLPARFQTWPTSVTPLVLYGP